MSIITDEREDEILLKSRKYGHSDVIDFLIIYGASLSDRNNKPNMLIHILTTHLDVR